MNWKDIALFGLGSFVVMDCAVRLYADYRLRKQYRIVVSGADVSIEGRKGLFGWRKLLNYKSVRDAKHDLIDLETKVTRK